MWEEMCAVCVILVVIIIIVIHAVLCIFLEYWLSEPTAVHDIARMSACYVVKLALLYLTYRSSAGNAAMIIVIWF